MIVVISRISVLKILVIHSLSPTATAKVSHHGTAAPTARSPAGAGETFLALLQNALWQLGGVPRVIRSDNTSALTHEIKRSRGRALNDNYAEPWTTMGSSPP